MKQMSFFPAVNKEHGGVHAVGRKRSARPCTTKQSMHVTLRSQHATKQRALTNHRGLIRAVIMKACKLFHIRVYEYAVCSNHIHLLVRGRRRDEIQNFFRVLAGHVAQQILVLYPIPEAERGAPAKGCAKNQRKFWEFLTYTRVVSWGREYDTVRDYIVRNTLEALGILAYKPRKRARGKPP